MSAKLLKPNEKSKRRLSQNQYNKLRKWEETIEEDLEIEKENWKKLKKEKRKENGGKLLHLSYSMFHLSYRDTLCPDLLVSRGTPLLDICVYNACRHDNLSSVINIHSTCIVGFHMHHQSPSSGPVGLRP